MPKFYALQCPKYRQEIVTTSTRMSAIQLIYVDVLYVRQIFFYDLTMVKCFSDCIMCVKHCLDSRAVDLIHDFYRFSHSVDNIAEVRCQRLH